MPARYPTDLERQLRRAYAIQRQNATYRRIPFLFTFEEWSAWWLTDNRWARRGHKTGQLQMGRKDIAGPYSLDNIECVTKEENQLSQLILALTPERRAAAAKKGGLARSGEKHWRATPVVTPLGTFVTITAAAKAHGIDPTYGSLLAKKKRNGWRYLYERT
jgi:hypothetical protein